MNDYEERLEDALSEYFESCVRNGYHNMEENARFFVNENKHMGASYDEVLDILKKIEETY